MQPLQSGPDMFPLCKLPTATVAGNFDRWPHNQPPQISAAEAAAATLWHSAANSTHGAAAPLDGLLCKTMRKAFARGSSSFTHNHVHVAAALPHKNF